jgi:hypothetical protein
MEVMTDILVGWVKDGLVSVMLYLKDSRPSEAAPDWWNQLGYHQISLWACPEDERRNTNSTAGLAFL